MVSEGLLQTEVTDVFARTGAAIALGCRGMIRVIAVKSQRFLRRGSLGTHIIVDEVGDGRGEAGGFLELSVGVRSISRAREVFF